MSVSGHLGDDSGQGLQHAAHEIQGAQAAQHVARQRLGVLHRLRGDAAAQGRDGGAGIAELDGGHMANPMAAASAGRS